MFGMFIMQLEIASWTGKVTSTAYLGTYVDDTGVIDAWLESRLVLVLWVAITIGRLAGVQDQRFLTNKVS